MVSDIKETEALRAAPKAVAPALPVPRRRASAWARFRRHRLAVLGAFLLLLLVALTLFAPAVFHLNPTAVDLRSYEKPPGAGHWLGTDAAGRDVFSRLVYGGRVSLSVGIVAVGFYIVVGVLLGTISGYYGGRLDSLVMRLADVFMAFPRLIIIITLAALVSPSIYNVMLIIGLLGWPPTARIVRGQLLSLRERDFVLAARVLGAGDWRIMSRHLMPNVVAPVIVAATFGTAEAILLEAALSFLGLGVRPPMASWGNMLNAAESITILQSMPWLWLPPGLMIAVTVLSLNFLGDGLRDALDPRHTA